MDLIIGASGLIGSHLMEKFHPSAGTYFSNKAEGLVKLDIASYDETEKLLKQLKPKNIFLPAAIPAVDYCETHESETIKTNIDGLRNVLEVAKELNTKIIYFSSEYVFDGLTGPYSENDKPNPINIYGKQKLVAELLVQKCSNNYIIVRTIWVYGNEKARKNFMYAVIDNARKGRNLMVPKDEFSNPTSAKDLAKALHILINKNYKGIINIAGPDRMSKFEFAKKIAEIFNLSQDFIQPVASDKIQRPAKRPKNAGLKVELLNSLGINMRSLEDNLNDLKTVVL